MLRKLVESITYKRDSQEILALCEADAQLAMLIRHFGDLSYKTHTNPFTHTVDSIISQMLSSKAANAIAARLYKLCDGEYTPSVINQLSLQDLKAIGLSGQKAEYIKSLASHLLSKPEFFSTLVDLSDVEIIEKLTALRGIGIWSAKMYLIFVLNRLDVLPYEDGAFLQAYKWLYSTSDVNPEAITKNCERWKPYSSLATRYLYWALDSGYIRDSNMNKKLHK